MSFASMHNDYLDPDMYGGWDDVPENCTDCGDELPEEESGTVLTRYEALCAKCASDRIESLESQIEFLEAQRNALYWVLKEVAVAADGAETHLATWVADKAEAAIAKVRGVSNEGV